MRLKVFFIAMILVGICLIEGMAHVQQDDEQQLRHVVDSLLNVLQSEKVTPIPPDELFTGNTQEQLLNQLIELRKYTAGRDAADISVSPRDVVLVYETEQGPLELAFELTKPPFRIASITLDRSGLDQQALTWNNVESVLDTAAKEGFAGACLLTRNGKIVMHKAYGLANRESKIANSIDTVFAIGSAPIDFTHASVLILRDQGKIALDDLISKYFNGVPADKQTITIRHLMTGQSGLRDFHDLPGDKEPDHTWIDRDEAVRRIMNHQLLFKPGQGREHSHSAWGLLAAIVEISSGQTYQDFTRENLYQPAGMTDTGFFGDRVDEHKIAVGYGHRKSSDPNSPPHWGKTSWLVMGSGGQVSTLADLYRWELAIRAGKIMSPESTKQFIGRGNRVSADGDSYGFEFLHSHNPECMFMIISNAISTREKRKQIDQLGRRLHQLVKTELNKPERFSIGLTMTYDPESDVALIDQVAEGGPAAKAGLKSGDQLISAAGVPFGDPRAVFRQVLQSGDPFHIKIDRNGNELEFQLRPGRRNQERR